MSACKQVGEPRSVLWLALPGSTLWRLREGCRGTPTLSVLRADRSRNHFCAGRMLLWVDLVFPGTVTGDPLLTAQHTLSVKPSPHNPGLFPALLEGPLPHHPPLPPGAGGLTCRSRRAAMASLQVIACHGFMSKISWRLSVDKRGRWAFLARAGAVPGMSSWSVRVGREGWLCGKLCHFTLQVSRGL